MKIKRNFEKGFTLVELIVYMAGLLALGSVLIVMIMQFYGLYKEVIAIPRADRTGLLLIDTLTKEIRSARAIDVIDSQFNTTNGVLSLISNKDETEIKKKFFIQDGKVYSQINSNTLESLTGSTFTVSNLHFYFVPTNVSQGVRFVIELQYEARDGIQTKMYSGFAILRESYE
jgi:hypothetical protein